MAQPSPTYFRPEYLEIAWMGIGRSNQANIPNLRNNVSYATNLTSKVSLGAGIALLACSFFIGASACKALSQRHLASWAKIGMAITIPLSLVGMAGGSFLLYYRRKALPLLEEINNAIAKDPHSAPSPQAAEILIQCMPNEQAQQAMRAFLSYRGG